MDKNEIMKIFIDEGVEIYINYSIAKAVIPSDDDKSNAEADESTERIINFLNCEQNYLTELLDLSEKIGLASKTEMLKLIKATNKANSKGALKK